MKQLLYIALMALLSLSASAGVVMGQIGDSTNVIKDTVQLNEVLVKGNLIFNKTQGYSIKLNPHCSPD